MRSCRDWQWWAFVAVAFFYGLAVMVAVMVFVRRSKLRPDDGESRSVEFNDERVGGQELGETMI